MAPHTFVIVFVMHILLSEPAVRAYVDSYIDFLTDCLVRFEVYCTKRLGERSEDYQAWLTNLEGGYEQLVKDIPSFANRMLRNLILQLQTVLARAEAPSQLADHCELLIRQFLYVDENLFRRDYFDARARAEAGKTYSLHLLLKIDRQLQDGNYDSALVEAFKVLEVQLVDLVSPAERLHGQSLMRKAFSGEVGTLRLEGTAGEQKGLAEFAAGVFGLFRNPSAHRDVFNPGLEALAAAMLSGARRPLSFHDGMTAQTVVAVVALLLKASTALAIQNQLIAADDISRYPFGSLES